MSQSLHQTVLLNEAVEALTVNADGHYLDATFGRGGHSQLILSQLGAQGRLSVVDCDPEAIAVAEAMQQSDDRISIHAGGF